MDAGSVEKFESMRGDPRYNPLYLFPSRIADFSPVTPAVRGEDFLGRREMAEKNWKNTSFDFAVYPCRGMETTVQELFRPSRGRLSGFLRDEPALFPSPPFGEIWDLGRALGRGIEAAR